MNTVDSNGPEAAVQRSASANGNSASRNRGRIIVLGVAIVLLVAICIGAGTIGVWLPWAKQVAGAGRQADGIAHDESGGGHGQDGQTGSCCKPSE